MENSTKIELLTKRLQFLNSVLSGFIQVGDIKEIEATQAEISACETELSQIIELENANRQSEISMD